MGAVGLGLVDCHCHLSAPDFDHVREGEVGPVGAGRPPSFTLRVILPWGEVPRVMSTCFTCYIGSQRLVLEKEEGVLFWRTPLKR